MYNSKIFFGVMDDVNVPTADKKFNDWIEDHPNIEIIQFRYQQARYGDHSIAILYKENN